MKHFLWIGFALFGAPATAAETAPPAAAAPQRVLAWDVEALEATPAMHQTTECPVEGMQAFFYEGVAYKSKPTHVFAYYAAPQGEPPEGGWPAVVCAHGGGGTAYAEWVKTWNEHGYAAIAMDLEGRLPDGRPHANAGPARIDWFGDRDLPDHEQWFYHAAADVVRAHSLLRSFAEINPAKIGLTGISWGGTIAAAVAGVDARFAFVIPVYGCGFIHESDNPGLSQWFPPTHMTAVQFRDYQTKWDPSVHLPYAKMPMHWMNGTNDGTFSMEIFQRSASLPAGPTSKSIRIRWLHGHAPGWRQKEIYAFADSVIGDGVPLLKLHQPTFDPATRTVTCQVKGKLVSNSLNFTTADGPWKTRWWDSLVCEVTPDGLTAQLPADAKYFFFNARDERGCLSSTDYVEV
ncbi:MAG: acetylxylan esterase, partial [Pirellulales bacterium]